MSTRDPHTPESTPASPRYRNVSGKPLNRRVVMKAAAGLTAMVAAGSAVTTMPNRVPGVAAQEVDGTRAREWVEADVVDTEAAAANDGWVTFEAEFPFWAIGCGWDEAVGWWPVVELQISYDGSEFSEVIRLAGRSDGGPKPTDGRIYTDLFFSDGQQFIRYRTIDGEGNPVRLDRFLINYIDPTDGPWEQDRATTFMRTSNTTAANTDTDAPPTIITRAQWGANENLRYSGGEEIWPSEYQTVQHAIVHHAAVNYGSDGYNAVRSIYYYHAVTQGWGDIGYNYVIDTRGNIFEGRVGGANVIGGHAYEYANGSSGICIMGDFSYADAPYVAKVALSNILAYVTRDLDPYGRAPFHQVPSLPTICGHRDVVQSTCPGNGLYDDLPWLRDTVAAILDRGDLDTGKAAGIVPGDRVRVATPNGEALPFRNQASSTATILANIPNGTLLEVERGPVTTVTDNWYEVFYNGQTGWVTAWYLIVDPPIADASSAYTFGQNIRVRTSAALRTGDGTGYRVIATVPAGEWGFVMAGPSQADGYAWYQIKTQNYGDGWMALPGFELAPVYNPASKFPVGSSVVTTTTASLRVRPGIAQTASGSAGAGTTLTLSVPPIAVTGRIWYGVHSQATGGGWVEESQLRAGSATEQPAGPVTATGQRFRVTEALNMRTGAGTNYGIVATLPAGTTGAVIGGPTNASGYTWWNVRIDSGRTGWVVTNWIEQIRAGTTPNPEGFQVGVNVRTTTWINIRSGAGTSYSVVGDMQSNTNGVITDGPRIAEGYTWWKVRSSTGVEGWVVQRYLVRTSGPEEPGPEPTNPVQGIGDYFVSTVQMVLRWEPRAYAVIKTTLPPGTTGQVIGGFWTADGLLWWNVRTTTGDVGFVPTNQLERTDPPEEPDPDPVNPVRSIGDYFLTTGQLTIRSAAGINAPVKTTLPAGTTGQVIGGWWFADGQRWWNVQTSSGVTGFVREDELQRTDQAPTPPTNSIRGVGDYFVSSGQITLRWEAGSNAAVKTTLPSGTAGQVIGGFWVVDGVNWWNVRTTSGTTGFVSGSEVQRTDTPPSMGKFFVGDSYRVTETVNMRTGPTTSSAIVATLPVGSSGTIVGGPSTANGYTWWNVRSSSGGTGWVAENWISRL